MAEFFPQAHALRAIGIHESLKLFIHGQPICRFVKFLELDALAVRHDQKANGAFAVAFPQWRFWSAHDATSGNAPIAVFSNPKSRCVYAAFTMSLEWPANCFAIRFEPPVEFSAVMKLWRKLWK